MNKVLILIHDIYEDLELWYPKIRLEEARIETVVAAPEKHKTYKGKHGYPCSADIAINEVHTKNYSGLLIPGGYAPDKLRRDPKVLEIVNEFHKDKKPIAFICHAGWVLISAKILQNKKVTSVAAIKDDIINAGAQFLDEPLVIDENLISSRTPKDLPVFAKALVEMIG
ncbi:MAG: type 1 glutamine amidotransferase domain-containing protein [Chlamydiota bacterium]|jgi:protease I